METLLREREAHPHLSDLTQVKGGQEKLTDSHFCHVFEEFYLRFPIKTKINMCG